MPTNQHTAYLANLLTRLNAAPAPLAIDMRVHLLRPQHHALTPAHAALLPPTEHYFRLTLPLHPIPTRAELLSTVARRFCEDWAHEAGEGGVVPGVDWDAAARMCCVMTTRTSKGPVRVKMEADKDVARLVRICGERGAEAWMWTLVVGG